MTDEILKLEIIHFDTMENSSSNAISKKEYFFKRDGELTAHGVLGAYLITLNFTPYIAWNGEVYPQFKVSRVLFSEKVIKGSI
jgi:hypothetical protein